MVTWNSVRLCWAFFLDTNKFCNDWLLTFLGRRGDNSKRAHFFFTFFFHFSSFFLFFVFFSSFFYFSHFLIFYIFLIFFISFF